MAVDQWLHAQANADIYAPRAFRAAGLDAVPIQVVVNRQRTYRWLTG
jgi:hypothetical protein